MSPKVSVIMPFYNCEKFLDESIQSIINQTFRDFELIIINDASTDSSDKIVQKYLYDKRIVYIKNNKNKQIVFNLNYGLNIAKSDIVARMDGDDISDIKRLELQYNYLLENQDIAVVGSFVKIIDENGNETGERKKFTDPATIKREFLIQSSLVHPSVMYRKNIVQKVGSYRQEFVLTEDLDLWYRIVYSGYKITNIPEFLLKYREHSNSTSKKNKSKLIKQFKSRFDAIRFYKLKLRPKDYFFLSIHFVSALLLTGPFKQKIEGLYVKLFRKI